MKRIILPVILGLSMIVTACGEQMKTEEIYEQAITAMDELETVSFQRNQTLRAQQESFRSEMNGVIQFEPFEAYADVQMTLLNLTESLDMDMHVTDQEWKVRSHNPGATWQERDRTSLNDVIFNEPASLLTVFEPYSEEFLMKESEIRYFENGAEDVIEEEEEEEEEVNFSVYEVSFRGSDEQYKPLIKQHIEQMGLTTHPNVDIEQVLNTVEIERIDMTIFIDKETFDVHRFQTRFRYSVELLDEYRVIDESLLLRFQNHNEVSSIEEHLN